MGVSRKNTACRNEIRGTKVRRPFYETVEEGISNLDMNALKFTWLPSKYPIRFLENERQREFRCTFEHVEDEKNAWSVQNSSYRQLTDSVGKEADTKFSRHSEEEEAENYDHGNESMLPLGKSSRTQDPVEGGARKSFGCRKLLIAKESNPRKNLSEKLVHANSTQ